MKQRRNRPEYIKIHVTPEEHQTLKNAAARVRGNRSLIQYGLGTWAREVLLGIAGRGDQLVLEEMLRRTSQATEHLQSIRDTLRDPTDCPECNQRQYYDEILNCIGCGYSPLGGIDDD